MKKKLLLLVFLFYCLNFNRLWDYGAVKPFTNNNCNVLSTNKTTAQSFSIYPNPTNAILNIQNKQESIITTVNIMDISGKKLSSNSNHKNNYSLDISHLTAGIYFVEILTENTKTTHKIIKN